MLSRRNIIERLASHFDRMDAGTVVYLFGSHARGDADATSDVDVAVWFEQRTDFLERDEIARELSE